MENLDVPAQVLGGFGQELDPRHDQTWTIAAIGHGDQIDFLVPREFTVLVVNSLVAVGAGDAGVVFDAFAV
jgi:hypothetical protein